MARMIFCNIGWMSRYQGISHQPDKIVGGGRYPRDNGMGGEVCNFLGCDDGQVYGHVESIRGEVDRKIRLENWGGVGNSLSAIDLVWTATHPTEGGRRVVGWYRNATIFRERQFFHRPPSKQHRIDEIGSYRVRAQAKDAHLLTIEDRTLTMPRGPGWLGQTPWWSPPEDAAGEVLKFIQQVQQLLNHNAQHDRRGKSNGLGSHMKNSPDTASDPYIRYVTENEIQISPRHNGLQKKFEAFLATIDSKEIGANLESVDLRYIDAARGSVLVEVKPCEVGAERFAIRTAMGQLLDYRQRADGNPSLLIVIEVEPNDQDKRLATMNGFGIAYPFKNTFKVFWPSR